MFARGERGLQPVQLRYTVRDFSQIALRIEGWLGVENGGRADVWMGQQCAYDMWQARKAGIPRVKKAKWEGSGAAPDVMPA